MNTEPTNVWSSLVWMWEVQSVLPHAVQAAPIAVATHQFIIIEENVGHHSSSIVTIHCDGSLPNMNTAIFDFT